MNQHNIHPNVHAPWQQWSADATLHVAVCYSNPYRWDTRRELMNDFRAHMQSLPNVCLHVGELAYGDRPFEVTDPKTNPCDYQFRTDSALFHKENVQNAIIARFPCDWKYGACIDGDFTFTRRDIALEAIHQLQHHPWVQLFSQYADLTGNVYGQAHRIISMNNGFAYNYINNTCQLPAGYANGGWKTNVACKDPYTHEMISSGVVATPKLPGVGATGGAWAFTREGLAAVGSLLDVCILGHGDWFMTFGLVNEDAPDMHIDGYSPDYLNAIKAWQTNAAKLKKNIGYVDCFATHHFHGSKKRRAYGTRDTILVNNKFSPVKDLLRDAQGIFKLNGDKPRLRDDIRAYFVSRNEDDPTS